MTQHFRFDMLAVIFTLAFIAITAWICWRVVFNGILWWPEVLMAVMFTICSVVCLAYMPRYTYIDRERIVVKKVIGEHSFNRSEVKVRPLEQAELKSGVRTFGSGGVFGYLGWHRLPNVGKCFVLLKNRQQSIALIEHGDRKYIVHLKLE